jgi:hypothetical protein
MANANILLILADQNAELLERSILRPAGYEVTLVSKIGCRIAGKVIPPDVIIMGEKLRDGSGFDLALLAERFQCWPSLLADSHSEELVIKAMRPGSRITPSPLRPNDVLQAVSRPSSAANA